MHIHPNAALVAIDVQKGFDCDSWGQRNNPGMEANGRALIAAWRATGRPLIHTRHDSVTPGSPLAPGQDGNGFEHSWSSKYINYVRRSRAVTSVSG